METFNINTNEKFIHLSKAPIHEAVIELRTPSATSWEKEMVHGQLEASLTDYPKSHTNHTIEANLEIQSGPSPEPKQHGTVKWHGFRRRSEDGRNIAQFNRDSFLFSRLNPYRNWTQFIDEAMRLWNIYCEITKCTEITRIGLRYVNRIKPNSSSFDIEDFLTAPPREPLGLELPFIDFLHRDIHTIPGHPYRLTLIKTLQVEGKPDMPRLAIVLDIDVHADVKTSKNKEIREHLGNMRWLKNKAFFGSITEKTKEIYQ